MKKPLNKEETSYIFKVCLFGDEGVGKTSLINRLGVFESDQFILRTQGFEIKKRCFTVDEEKIRLDIFDMKSFIKEKSVLIPFFKGISGGIYVFDLGNRSSLESLNEWMVLLNDSINHDEKKIPIIIVGNKKDLGTSREISFDRGLEVAKHHELTKYIEASVKTGENVKEIFISISTEILKNLMT